MVEILPTPQRKPSIGERLSAGAGAGLQSFGQIFQAQQQQKLIEQQKRATASLYGENVANLPPDLQKLAAEYGMKGDLDQKKRIAELQGNQKIIRALEKERGYEEGALDAYIDDPKMAEQVSRLKKEKEPTFTEKPVPEEYVNKIEQIIKDNPNATADEIGLKLDKAGIPPGYSGRYVENRRREEEQTRLAGEKKIAALSSVCFRGEV